MYVFVRDDIESFVQQHCLDDPEITVFSKIGWMILHVIFSKIGWRVKAEQFANSRQSETAYSCISPIR